MNQKNLAPFQSGGLANMAAMRTALHNAGARTQSSTGGRDILKLDRGNGSWVYGVNSTILGDNEIVLVNPASFIHGWIAWGEGVIEGEVMTSVANPMPTMAELPPLPVSKDPDEKIAWAAQMGFQAALTDGTQLIYKANSMGGREFIGELATNIGDRMGVDESTPVPAILLSNTFYKHTKWGRVYKPAYVITDWLSMGDTSVPAQEEQAAQAAAQAAAAAQVQADTEEMMSGSPVQSAAAPPPRQRRRRA